MERGGALPRDVTEGDVLLGFASDGVHSNGFSLVRRIVEASGLGLDAPSPFGDGTLGSELLAPTRIYVRSALAALGTGGLRGLAHITGGGLTENVPRMLPDGSGAEIDLDAWNLPAGLCLAAGAGRGVGRGDAQDVELRDRDGRGGGGRPGGRGRGRSGGGGRAGSSGSAGSLRVGVRFSGAL